MKDSSELSGPCSQPYQLRNNYLKETKIPEANKYWVSVQQAQFS